MANAVRRVQQHWRPELAEVLAGRTGRDRLATFVDWWTTGTAQYDVFRLIWVEMLAMRDSNEVVSRALQQEAHAERDEVVAVLTESRIADPQLRADMLYLLLRGINISSVEDPETWPAERGRQAALALVELMPSTPTSSRHPV
jgi:hypothetical protein